MFECGPLASVRADLGLEGYLQRQPLEGEHLVSNQKARDIPDSTPYKGELGVKIGKLLEEWNSVARGGSSAGVPPHQN